MTQIIENYADMMKNYDPSKNISRNVLTRYERAKIIGMRLEQLAHNAPIYIDTTGITSLREIALKELELKKIPFLIVRPLANGKEIYKLEDMIV